MVNVGNYLKNKKAILPSNNGKSAKLVCDYKISNFAKKITWFSIEKKC